MPIPNPAEQLAHAPLSDLVEILLKQFKRLLEERGVRLTTARIQQIGAAAARREGFPPETDTIRDTLAVLVQESLDVLRDRFDFSFAEALQADMSQVTGWETTAEFIELANHKSNAELRISAGASLLAMLGDAQYAGLLLHVIEADAGANDVDAVFARRALSHLTGAAPAAPDWEEQVRRWLAESSDAQRPGP